jgi:hypothetical protein
MPISRYRGDICVVYVDVFTSPMVPGTGQIVAVDSLGRHTGCALLLVYRVPSIACVVALRIAAIAPTDLNPPISVLFELSCCRLDTAVRESSLQESENSIAP